MSDYYRGAILRVLNRVSEINKTSIVELHTSFGGNGGVSDIVGDAGFDTLSNFLSFMCRDGLLACENIGGMNYYIIKEKGIKERVYLTDLLVK